MGDQRRLPGASDTGTEWLGLEARPWDRPQEGERMRKGEAGGPLRGQRALLGAGAQAGKDMAGTCRPPGRGVAQELGEELSLRNGRWHGVGAGSGGNRSEDH